MRFLLLIFVLILAAAPAYAEPGQVVQCGAPTQEPIGTSGNFDYCDIYRRQIGYMPNNQAFRRQIDERRENYNAARAQALAAYNEWDASRYPAAEEKTESTPEEKPSKPAIAAKATAELSKAELSKAELSRTEQLNLEQLAKIRGNS